MKWTGGKPGARTDGVLACGLVAALLLGGCARSRPEVVLAPLPAAVERRVAREPIRFPRDEAPHDVLTEWWYYTGHLRSEDGRQYGFEYVIFQTVRGDYPVLYLGQFAITDRSRGTFHHTSQVSQGSQIGGQDALELAIQDWRMAAVSGRAQLRASVDNYAVDLELRSTRPPVFHDDDGIVSFGPAGDSYYYSYTRLAVTGTLVDAGTPLAVTGQAWFDHQWGDFLVLGGGWDWYSIQLDDGSDLMLNYLRDDDDTTVGVWGTYIAPSGEQRVLTSADFAIEPLGRWTSPKSGVTYPMGWNVTLAQPAYRLRLSPVLADQELVPEAGGRGLIYWEGAVEVIGASDAGTVRGLGYVEMTGYARR